MLRPAGILDRPFRAVLFDAGGTLLRPYPSVREIYSRIAADFGMHVDPDSLGKRFAKVFSRKTLKPLTDKATEKDWWRYVVHETFSPLTTLQHFDDFFSTLWEFFRHADAWRLYPDTLPALRLCRDLGMKTGIVSNWDSRLPDVIKNMHIDSFFDMVAVSALVGSAKPDPALFLFALENMGVEPDEALHIGDIPDQDGLGAQQAGIFPVIIDRSEKYSGEFSRVKSLCDAVGMVH